MTCTYHSDQNPWICVIVQSLKLLAMNYVNIVNNISLHLINAGNHVTCFNTVHSSSTGLSNVYIVTCFTILDECMELKADYLEGLIFYYCLSRILSRSHSRSQIHSRNQSQIHSCNLHQNLPRLQDRVRNFV